MKDSDALFFEHATSDSCRFERHDMSVGNMAWMADLEELSMHMRLDLMYDPSSEEKSNESRHPTETENGRRVC